jgi:hypothetical protein
VIDVFIFLLQDILNLLSCVHIKNCFIFKLDFGRTIFFLFTLPRPHPVVLLLQPSNTLANNVERNTSQGLVEMVEDTLALTLYGPCHSMNKGVHTCLSGECIVKWLNSGKNCTPYKSIQDLKWLKWTCLLLF